MNPSNKSSLRVLRSAIFIAAVIQLPTIALAQSNGATGNHDTHSSSMSMPMPMKNMNAKDADNKGNSMAGGADMMQSMTGTQEKMQGMKMSGDPDYDFAEMMRMHHQGAISMAKMELDHGKNPAMRNAAKKIIAAQKKEIAEFDRWIAQHKPMSAMPANK